MRMRLNRFLTIAVFVLIYGKSTLALAEEAKPVDYDNLVQALIKFGEISNNPEDKKAGEEIKKSYEAEQKAKKKLEEREEKLAILREMESTPMPNKDMFHEVIRRIQKNTGVDGKTAFDMANRNAPEAQKAFQQLIKEENDKLYNEIKVRRAAERKQREKSKQGSR